MTHSKIIKKSSHQQTLAETGFSKRTTSPETKLQSSPCKKRISGKSTSKNVYQLRTVKSNSNDNTSDHPTSKENLSDNDDFVESSQGIHKSKLRIAINENLSKKSISPKKLTPQKSADTLLSSSTEKRQSISEFCDVSSNVIKEEIFEMYNDIGNCESIEMTHDLSGLIVGNGSPLKSLEYSSVIISHNINMDSIKDEIMSEEELQDPLYIDENDKNSSDEKSMFGKRKSKSTLNDSKLKKISKSGNLKLSEKFLKKLKLLKIKIKHEVPPQHKIEQSAGSRPLHPSQIVEFETYGPLKKGQFKKSEDEIIRRNWRDFCKTHNWNEKDVHPFLYMRHNSEYLIPKLEERKQFVRFLANELPWRSLYSVYCRFKNLYATLNNGSYTPAEDEIILEYMLNETDATNKCAELAKLLNRKRHSVWQRFQKLKKHCSIQRNKNLDNIKKRKRKNSHNDHSIKQRKFGKIIHEKVYSDVKWTSPLVKKFIDTLLEVSSSEDLKELKYQTIDQRLWKEIEAKMSIDANVLYNFWYLQLHMQIFCPSPIYMNDLKIKFIKFIHKKKLQTFDDITYEEIRRNFNGITTLFLSKLFDYLIQHAQDKTNSSSIKDILEYLYKTHIPILENKSVEAILPKLLYKYGKIHCTDKGPEEKIPNNTSKNPFSDEDL